jgi:hypothetical protein
VFGKIKSQTGEMPSSEMRQMCSASFDPDSLGSNSVDSNSSRGSSEEKQLSFDNDVEEVRRRKQIDNDVRRRKQIDNDVEEVRRRKQIDNDVEEVRRRKQMDNDVRRRKQVNDDNDVRRRKQLNDDKSVTSAQMSAWNKSKKIEDELSQLWDTGQVGCQFRWKLFSFTQS